MIKPKHKYEVQAENTPFGRRHDTFLRPEDAVKQVERFLSGPCDDDTIIIRKSKND